jgi:hypothetical protein
VVRSSSRLRVDLQRLYVSIKNDNYYNDTSLNKIMIRILTELRGGGGRAFHSESSRN